MSCILTRYNVVKNNWLEITLNDGLANEEKQYFKVKSRTRTHIAWQPERQECTINLISEKGKNATLSMRNTTPTLTCGNETYPLSKRAVQILDKNARALHIKTLKTTHNEERARTAFTRTLTNSEAKFLHPFLGKDVIRVCM